jgi:hypothetical protein
VFAAVGDYARADVMYEAALEADAHSVDNLLNYSQFLEEVAKQARSAVGLCRSAPYCNIARASLPVYTPATSFRRGRSFAEAHAACTAAARLSACRLGARAQPEKAEAARALARAALVKVRRPAPTLKPESLRSRPPATSAARAVVNGATAAARRRGEAGRWREAASPLRRLRYTPPPRRVRSVLIHGVGAG